MISPTVGRKVWYRPSDEDKKTMEANGGEPLDATVVAVWSDRLVNLAIFDIYGMPHQRRSVQLVQEGDATPEHGRFAEWMPYQTSQAKKEAAA